MVTAASSLTTIVLIEADGDAQSNLHHVSTSSNEMRMHRSTSTLPLPSPTDTATTLQHSIVEKEAIEEHEQAAEEGSLPRREGGYQALRFLAAGFFVDAISWGLCFSFGSYESYFANAPDLVAGGTAVSYSAVGTTSLGLLYSLTLPGIIWCRRYPHRVKLMLRLALVVNVLSMIISSFANNVAVLILFQGVVGGISAGLMWSPVYVYLTEWFVLRRATAGAVLFAGSGLGGVVFPFLITKSCEAIGFRWTLRLVALIVLVVGGISVLGIVPRVPIARTRRDDKPFVDWSFFKNPILWISLIIVFCQGACYSSITVYISTYASGFLDFSTAGYVLAVTNGAAILGQLASGYCCDRISFKIVMGTSLFVSAAAVFLMLRVAETAAVIFGFAIAIGFFSGGFSSGWFPASNFVVRTGKMQASSAGEIFGIISLTRGLSSVIAPILVGLLYSPQLGTGNEQTSTALGKYGLANFVLFVGSFALAGFFFVGVLELLGRRRIRLLKLEEERAAEGSFELEKEK